MVLQDFPILQSRVHENTEEHLQQWREKKPEKEKKDKTQENMKLREHAFFGNIFKRYRLLPENY